MELSSEKIFLEKIEKELDRILANLQVLNKFLQITPSSINLISSTISFHSYRLEKLIDQIRVNTD